MQLHATWLTFTLVIINRKYKNIGHAVLLLSLSYKNKDQFWWFLIEASAHLDLQSMFCSFQFAHHKVQEIKAIIIVGFCVWMSSSFIEQQCYHFFEQSRQRHPSIKLSTALKICPSKWTKHPLTKRICNRSQVNTAQMQATCLNHWVTKVKWNWETRFMVNCIRDAIWW